MHRRAVAKQHWNFNITVVGQTSQTFTVVSMIWQVCVARAPSCSTAHVCLARICTWGLRRCRPAHIRLARAIAGPGGCSTRATPTMQKSGAAGRHSQGMTSRVSSAGATLVLRCWRWRNTGVKLAQPPELRWHRTMRGKNGHALALAFATALVYISLSLHARAA